MSNSLLSHQQIKQEPIEEQYNAMSSWLCPPQIKHESNELTYESNEFPRNFSADQESQMMELDSEEIPPFSNPQCEKEGSQFSKIRDTLCINNSDIGYFWPVYVSNFPCLDRGNEFDYVKEYFFSKGLFVQLGFRHQGDYFWRVQFVTGVYDMLVYFLSERDAKYAIKVCHRDTYKGYTLNVFPGRLPVYFDKNRSLMIWKKKKGVIFNEQFFEKHLKSLNLLPMVTSTVKFNFDFGVMEFKSREVMLQAQKAVKKFKQRVLLEPLQKQRFLEKDVTDEIFQYLSLNPSALRIDWNDPYLLRLQERNSSTRETRTAKQRKYITKRLMEGRRPICYVSNETEKDRFYFMVRRIKKKLAKQNKNSK